jgi:hypothetical protein
MLLPNPFDSGAFSVTAPDEAAASFRQVSAAVECDIADRWSTRKRSQRTSRAGFERRTEIVRCSIAGR